MSQYPPNPTPKPDMWFTTSWDDGHPLDMRLAELMQRHGIPGTFYWPVRNDVEGLPVLSATEMRQLDTVVEVGSHTLEHAYATRMDTATWRGQVRSGKQHLEQIVGHAVDGFCYPGGKMTPQSRDIVIDAGFTYARTTANLHPGHAADVFAMPTSLQFYPHARGVLARNFMRHGDWMQRLPVALRCVGAPDFERRLVRALDACRRGQVFHLWGHSWEIDRYDLWAPLERFFALVDATVPRHARVTNAGLLQAQRRVA